MRSMGVINQEDCVWPLNTCVVDDFPVWRTDLEFEAEHFVNLSKSHREWTGQANVAVRISFAFNQCQNILIVRRDAFRPLTGRTERVTDKQFERLCKGIRAGTRTGLILENVKKRPMPSVIRLDIYRAEYDKKTTRLLAFEAATAGAIEKAIIDARVQIGI